MNQEQKEVSMRFWTPPGRVPSERRLRIKELTEAAIPLELGDVVVLDIGSGPGVLSGILKARLHICLDWLNDRFATELGYRLKDHVSGDACRLPVRSGSIDVLVCMETLDQVAFEERKLVIAECWRVVKPGGKMILGIPLRKPAKVHASHWDMEAVWREFGRGIKSLKVVTHGEKTLYRKCIVTAQVPNDMKLAPSTK